MDARTNGDEEVEQFLWATFQFEGVLVVDEMVATEEDKFK